jgi:glutamyl-tRNA synthetase
MTPEELIDLLIPYWQEAGYDTDDRPWLLQLTALITPSLTRLSDAVKESRLLFGEKASYSEEAISQLQQEGAAAILQSILEEIPESDSFTAVEAKDLVKRVTKAHNVKQGVVMKSLRAALMGELHGPDLMQSWALLHQKKVDRLRLGDALATLD